MVEVVVVQVGKSASATDATPLSAAPVSLASEPSSALAASPTFAAQPVAAIATKPAANQDRFVTLTLNTGIPDLLITQNTRSLSRRRRCNPSVGAIFF